LNQEDHFLFPVGKDGNLRWLELKTGSGNYTVEYIHQNPAAIGNVVGQGLDHISKLEYWTVIADGTINDQAKIELSFASGQSGIITDPNYLNVAKFQMSEWEDAGHTGITGNIQQGSVLSGISDFSAQQYTLGSVLDMENPLPLTSISLEVKELSGKPVFSWVVTTDEKPDHFNLYEETNNQSKLVARINAVDRQFKYIWTGSDEMNSGNHLFMVSMVDLTGHEYFGMLVPYHKEEASVRLRWVSSGPGSEQNQVLIYSPNPDVWTYEIISMEGRFIKKGVMPVGKDLTRFSIGSEIMSRGKYFFRATDVKGRVFVLAIEKN
jgi:hypothetical protein